MKLNLTGILHVSKECFCEISSFKIYNFLYWKYPKYKQSHFLKLYHQIFYTLRIEVKDSSLSLAISVISEFTTKGKIYL